jgi:hypothetical protein
LSGYDKITPNKPNILKERKHKFLCLNNRSTDYRLAMLARLYNLNLLHEGKITVNVPVLTADIANKNDLPSEVVEMFRSGYRDSKYLRRPFNDYEQLYELLHVLDNPEFYFIYYDIYGNEKRYPQYKLYSYIFKYMHQQSISSIKEILEHHQDIDVKRFLQEALCTTFSKYKDNEVLDFIKNKFLYMDLFLPFSNTMAQKMLSINKTIVGYDVEKDVSVAFNHDNSSGTLEMGDEYMIPNKLIVHGDKARPSTHYQNPSHASSSDSTTYDDCYFSIITETEQNSRYVISNKASFITEKTYKAIAHGHPFLIVSQPYTLEILRNMGFKTFNGFIDESYDLITDYDDRYDAIANEVKRLCNMNLVQMSEWYTEMRNILAYNKSVLWNTDFDLLKALKQVKNEK